MNLKILEPLENHLRSILSQKSQIDGRVWIVLILLAYFVVLWIASFFMDYSQFWQKIGVSSRHPSFADLREVLIAFDYTRLGYDVFVNFPGAHDYDPHSSMNQGMPYPRIWWVFAGLGLGEKHTIFLGVLFIFMFYLINLYIMGRLNLYEGIIYGLILVSPSIMLLMERCNVDILIYFSLALVLQTVARTNRIFIKTIAYSILWFSAILKLYAIFGLTVILREKKKIALMLIIIFSVAFLAYYFANLEEMRQISRFFKGFNATNRITFGLKSIVYTIKQFTKPGWFEYNFLGSKKLLILSMLFLILAGFYAVITGRIIVHSLRKFKDILALDNLEDNVKNNHPINLDYFRLGASLYIGIFILGTVWDTKLVFLIFTIPQILNWVKTKNEISSLSSLALVSIIGTLYMSRFFYKWGIDEVINWFLVVFFLYSLVLTLPQWLKLPLKNILPAKSPENQVN